MPSHQFLPQIRIVSLYHFTRFDDCRAIQRILQFACEENGIRAPLILASEGINGTIAGQDEAVEEVLQHIRSLPWCADITIKDSHSSEMLFLRLKVKIKQEIVTMGEPGVSPLHGVVEYVAPADWNTLISEPRTIVIDTRNSYEVEAGTFRGSINPGTRSFRDFPAWFRTRRDSMTGDGAPKVAMFCTGGIRCEKATALLKAEGVESVYHLQGGILKYLEEVPAEESLWDGECFVFDQRVCLTHGLETGTFDVCYACRMPVAEEAKASPEYEVGLSCPACHSKRSARQQERYAERRRQAQLAKERGERHIGPLRGDG